MVQTIMQGYYETLGPGVRVDVHHVERHVHGNGVAVKVWGELKIAAKQAVYARSMKLKTLQVLLLTPETGAHNPFTVSKQIHNKGELDNWASIDIFSMDGYQMEYSGRVSVNAAGSLPDGQGSIWLNFHALGE